MKNIKLILITTGAILAVLLLPVLYGTTINNSAIRQEENILESKSAISVQLKKRADGVKQLVQVVENFAEHEKGIISEIAQARAHTNEGNIEEAAVVLNAIVEQYPQIATGEAYKHLMNEISINENSLKKYRESYNAQVKKYKKYIRTFPRKQMLSFFGYEALEDEKYLDFGKDIEEIDTNMFGE